MEIRNQFVHNKSCSDILIAAERVSKTKYLKDFFDGAKDSNTQELNLELKVKAFEISFYKLFKSIYDDLVNATAKMFSDRIEELRMQTEKERAVQLNEMVEMMSEAIDKVSNIFDESFGVGSSDQKGKFKTAFNICFLAEYHKQHPEINLNDIFKKDSKSES
jgi:hypothetical protein